MTYRGQHLQRQRVNHNGERFGAGEIDQAKADRVRSFVGGEGGGFVQDVWAKQKITNSGISERRNVRFAETGATGWAVHAGVDPQWQGIVVAVRWNKSTAINDLDLHRGVTGRTSLLVQTGLRLTRFRGVLERGNWAMRKTLKR